MNLILNNKERNVPDDVTLQDLIEMSNVSTHPVVWVNGKKLLNSQHDSYVPKEGDKIKIIRLLFGG